MKCVMVVDDDEGIRQAIADVLVDEGFEVLTAENGRAAFDQLEAGECPNLILLDIMMPEMDGRQFRAAQLMHNRFGSIPVVLLTAGGNAQEVAKELQIAKWLNKPVQLKLLVDTINAAS